MKYSIKSICLTMVALLYLASCSQTVKTTSNKKQITSSSIKKKVIPNASSVLAIEGMVCKMGCGASIRKSLSENGGVANCEIDFKERKVNFLKIKYDSTQVTLQKMMQLLSTINDKQFKVTLQ